MTKNASTPARGESRWRFPDNHHGEIQGFNNAGVRTFDANTVSSVVRESIQNSLDAALDRDGRTPVKVEFELFSMNGVNLPDAERLYVSLSACADYWSKDKRASKFFNRAADDLNGKIPVLRISDHGTTGLRGARTGEVSTDWSRLIKESGSSSKDDFSGGSFGIGKYATFACSGMRCVFFSSLDDTGVHSSIGVARLASFLEDGHITTGVGYYSDNEENSAILDPLAFPGAYTRKQGDTGTDIYVIDCLQTDGLMESIRREVLINFLVSIWKGRLEVVVDGKPISKANIASYVGELNPQDPDESVVIQHFDLLRPGAAGVTKVVLDPMQHEFARKWGYKQGEAVLYLAQGDGFNRTIMMTRAQGMRLFEQNRMPGSINFTGILMIEGQKMNEDFRQMEAPSHDKWEEGRAENPKKAKQRYKELRDWLREMVQAAYAPIAGDKVDAFNAGLYLPKDPRARASVSKRSAKGEHKNDITKPRKVRAHKKAVKPKARGGMHDEGQVGSEPGALGTMKGSSSGQRSGARGGMGSGDKPGLTYVPIRSRAMSAGSANTYKVKLVVPQNVSRCMLEVKCDGEQSQSDLVVKRAHVVRGNIEQKEIDGNRIALGACAKGEVIEVEFSPDFDRPCMMEVNFYAAK